MKLQESGENYLETILVLKERNGTVRSVDVAREMHFSKPSVCRAVSVLREAGHLSTDEEGALLLTPSGQEIAKTIYERHQFLSKFLMSIGVGAETAAADACRIEHAISVETFDRLREYAHLEP